MKPLIDFRMTVQSLGGGEKDISRGIVGTIYDLKAIKKKRRRIWNLTEENWKLIEIGVCPASCVI